MSTGRANVCAEVECEYNVLARRLCSSHYQQWISRQKGYGRFESMYVDATPVIEHLEHLRSTGISLRTIASTARVPRRTLQRLLSRETPPKYGPTKVLSSTANVLLSIRTVPMAPSALIPAIGTQRRLQALVALGWPQHLIASELGMEPTNLSRMIHGRCGSVTATRAAAVTDLYTRWEMTPGPSRRARARAATLHWTPPLGWDENVLDDPDAVPFPR